jgi:hypothetical protein
VLFAAASNQVRHYPKSIAGGIIQIAPEKNLGHNLYKLGNEEHSSKTYDCGLLGY